MSKYAPPVLSNVVFSRSLIALSIAALFSSQTFASSMSEEGIEYEGESDNVYAINIRGESLSDLTSISVKGISFKNMNEKSSDPIYGGNGGIKIQYSNVVGAPISNITVENIVQESVNPKLVFNETQYYGVRFSNNDSIAANQISVNNVTAKGSLAGAFGMLNDSTTLSYGTIKISNINAIKQISQARTKSSSHRQHRRSP